MSANDMRWISRALDLAEASVGLASPNPQVGCVLVRNEARRNEAVLGEGAHLYDARDHAEIAALKQAAAAAREVRGATAYVTLEPCSHQGRTGPCADALIAAGIARCVVATADPNPQVSGRGIARMRAAGIAVEIGTGEQRARRLNDAFAFSITQGRPLVTLKAGLSVDGRLAPPPALRVPGMPHWLTSPPARDDVQRLRHAADAILTGIGTVLADDPLLTDRSGLGRRRPLQRIVLDPRLRLPAEAKLLDAAETLWLFHGADAPESRRNELIRRGVRLTQVHAAPRLALGEVLQHLHAAGLLGVLLEAGPALNGAFLEADLVDAAVLYYAAQELGPASLPFASTAAGETSPFALEQRMLTVAKSPIGPDVRVSGLLHDPWAGLALVR